jgi:hypothetical protein
MCNVKGYTASDSLKNVINFWSKNIHFIVQNGEK